MTVSSLTKSTTSLLHLTHIISGPINRQRSIKLAHRE